MPESDAALSALLDDLSSLPAQQRREVFAALRPYERIQIEALLSERHEGVPGDVEPKRPAPIFSSTIADCIVAAGENHVDRSGRMFTAATRERLQFLAEQAREQGDDEQAAADGAPQPALLARLMRLATRGRARP